MDLFRRCHMEIGWVSFSEFSSAASKINWNTPLEIHSFDLVLDITYINIKKIKLIIIC